MFRQSRPGRNQGASLMMTIRHLAGAAAATLLLAAPVLAVDSGSVTFAQFTQQSSDKVAQFGATATGNTLTIDNAPAFLVAQAFAPPGVYNSSFSMNASSSHTVVNTGPQFEQRGWNGQMTFTNGINQLTVGFANAVFNYDATGGSGSLIATDPADTISYTSELFTLPDFGFRNFSLAFTAMTPPFNVNANGFGSAFNANVAGSFAGSEVPEPPVAS